VDLGSCSELGGCILVERRNLLSRHEEKQVQTESVKKSEKSGFKFQNGLFFAYQIGYII
jgi:hypothetical protein